MSPIVVSGPRIGFQETTLRRIAIAITGASGSIYGYRLLQQLSAAEDVEVHLIVTSSAWLTIKTELDLERDAIESLADVVHRDKNIGASIASGSFGLEAMIVAPCSMKSLAAIATGNAGTLVARAADVLLKERRRLILIARETPLNLVHLRNMVTVTEMGGIIFPPVPAFYAHPETIPDIVDHSVGRILSLLDIETGLIAPWPGIELAIKDANG